MSSRAIAPIYLQSDLIMLYLLETQNTIRNYQKHTGTLWQKEWSGLKYQPTPQGICVIIIVPVFHQLCRIHLYVFELCCV